MEMFLTWYEKLFSFPDWLSKLFGNRDVENRFNLVFFYAYFERVIILHDYTKNSLW